MDMTNFWTFVIKLSVFFPFAAIDALTDNGEILVYFNQESLEGFQTPDIWIEAVKQTYQEKQQASEM